MLPALQFPAELLLRAQSVKLVFFDVDGVLTDGGLIYSEHGEALKRFNSLDGHGLKLLQQSGIVVAVITGRDSKALRLRLEALGITLVRYGTEMKWSAAQEILQSLEMTWEQAAAMGDDWPDLAMMHRCALACAPANAHAEVRAIAHYVTRAQGGHGAVRELCDLLLMARGLYGQLLRDCLQ